MQIRSHSGSFEHSTIQHLHCRFNFNQIAFHIFAYFPFVKLTSPPPPSDLKYFSRGLIDCKWEARLVGAPRKKRKEYYPFYVDYDSNYSPPGHFEIVRVYFKPRKTVGIKKKEKKDDTQFFFWQGIAFSLKKFIVPQCYIETKLNIIVDMSLEMPVISLTGRGIEKSLNIIKSEIHFNPVIPFTIIQEIDFTIENTCHYPVEFFWHHLDE